MSHTADVAQVNKTHGVKDERTEKRVAHIPPGDGARSLWVMGVLVTYKVPSQRTGGAYSLFEVATQGQVRHRTSTTARTSPSTL